MEAIVTNGNTGAPLPREDGARAKRLGESSSYTVQLSSNLDSASALCPMETTIARIEPHGAITLFRFTSGDHVERFELSAAEVDALVATNRRRRLLVNRFLDSANTEQGVLPF